MRCTLRTNSLLNDWHDSEAFSQQQYVQNNIVVRGDCIFDVGANIGLFVLFEELAVIQGIESNDWIKVKQIVAEVHDTNSRLEQFKLMLQNQGFEITIEKNVLLPASSNNFNVYAVRSLS